MKQNYFKRLFVALLLLCATVTSAHDFEKNVMVAGFAIEEGTLLFGTCKDCARVKL